MPRATKKANEVGEVRHCDTFKSTLFKNVMTNFQWVAFKPISDQ